MKALLRISLFISVFVISFSSLAYIQYVPQPTPTQIKNSEKKLENDQKALKKEIKTIKSEEKWIRKNKSKRKLPELPVPIHKEKKAHLPTSHWISSVSAPEEEKTAEALELGKPPYGDFGPLRFRKGITVTTSPLLGLKTAFNSSDLLYQYPSMNEDLILLRQRQYFEYLLRGVGDTLNNRAILMLSGGAEGQLVYNRNFNGREDDDINLSTAELDVAPFISTIVNGLIALDYDDSAPSTGSRVTNSRIYLSRGFLTLGNLNTTPVYFTIGQLYAPFGRYATLMLTTPLTESLARLEVRAAELGVYTNGFYGQVYGFMGNKTSGLARIARQGGVNAGFQTHSFDFGMGYVSNMADSQGMQNNGIDPFVTAFVTGNISQKTLSQFGGFSETPGGNDLVHSVPGLDGHVEFSHGPLTGIFEFITAVTRFAPSDMTFNNLGAAVKALHAEIDLTKDFGKIPLSFGFIYGQTWQALALNLPENTYAFVISTSIWKNTMMGIEYRHDVNYSRTNPRVTTGASLPVPTANIGGTRDLITLQFGAYF